MNIDEAIDIVNDLKKITQSFKVNCNLQDYEVPDAIETIINEYNNLKQIEETHKIENGKLREKINKIEKYVRGNKWSEDYKNSSCRTSILRILEEDK